MNWMNSGGNISETLVLPLRQLAYVYEYILFIVSLLNKVATVVYCRT